MRTVSRPEALLVAADNGKDEKARSGRVVTIVEYRDPHGAIQYDLFEEGDPGIEGDPKSFYHRATNPKVVWRTGWKGWMVSGEGLDLAPQGQIESQVTPLTVGDAYFLIGTAYAPPLIKTKDISAAILQVAQRIAAQIGDEGLVRRCEELIKELGS